MAAVTTGAPSGRARRSFTVQVRQGKGPQGEAEEGWAGAAV
jgi:hypothetical protein